MAKDPNRQLFNSITAKLNRTNPMKDQNDPSEMIEHSHTSAPLEDMSNSMSTGGDEVHRNEIHMPKQRFHRLMSVIRGKKPVGL